MKMNTFQTWRKQTSKKINYKTNYTHMNNGRHGHVFLVHIYTKSGLKVET